MQNTQTMEKPLVSFIITFYNLPVDMLRECVDSIMDLSLNRQEREIVIVDDGSDSCPLDALDDLTNNIIYIRQRNGGLSVARNTGLKMCNGKYVQFVDGDDYLNRMQYEHCLDIARYKDPDMVMFDFDSKPAKRRDIETEGPIDGTIYMKHHNLKATAWGYIFKKDILLDLRFTPGIYHEDEEFTPQLVLRAERMYVTDAVAYFYRSRPSSIVHNRNKRNIVKRMDDTEMVIMKLYDIACSMSLQNSMALRRRVAQLTMDYIYNIITVTKSKQQLDRRLERLEQKGLFPLPDNDYTTKYKWFRRMTMSKTSRDILFRLLQLRNRE